jgi:hypothetical protein
LPRRLPAGDGEGPTIGGGPAGAAVAASEGCNMATLPGKHPER